MLSDKNQIEIIHNTKVVKEDDFIELFGGAFTLMGI